MGTKKRTIVLLQSNHVGLFNCDHTLPRLPNSCPFKTKNLPLYVPSMAYKPPQSQTPSKVTTIWQPTPN